MVFAVRVAEGAKDYTYCAALQGEKREARTAYLSRFHMLTTQPTKTAAIREKP